MEWSFQINEKKLYFEVVTSGVVDKNGSLEMAKAISSALIDHNLNKILVDHRKIHSVSGSITEIYFRPKQFREIGIGQGIRIAEVIRPEHKEFFKFFETVCINRGYSFSIFHNKTDALEWLLRNGC